MLITNLMIMLTISCLFLLLIFSISKKKLVDREKLSPFECGFSTMNEGRNPLSLRFFLVTLIFLVFDIELILLFPFLMKIFFYSIFPHVAVFNIFLILLSLGLFLEWNQSMLEWA
uniref:NADH-ubiquinone oxidoreductase chain 3 n=1 Tax=Sinergasilus polycolpus TaxID=232557 RepID=C1INF7_SINPO|nr:NADH dehydrogenase subunit 3 [Sinergasilus polycolpus]ACB99586.1 NADH dehydrogenase subunit 3 [Sinergasilus polycolpus]ALG63359.1 NADH dehydrogenase subunit 3 [Sinergasilus polycolpus]